jgi:uncharacterized membrane protein YuzA (DUF378 family)
MVDSIYVQAWAHKLSMILLIVGALVWLIFGLFRVNVVERFLGRAVMARSIYILVGIAALYVMFDRDTYLPFLGEAVIPDGAFMEKTPERWNTKAVVDVPANTKVVFWAADGSGPGPQEAYGAYENAGTTISSADGKAELRVRTPQSYSVPIGGALAPHIHYRVFEANGMIGPVKTVFV